MQKAQQNENDDQAVVVEVISDDLDENIRDKEVNNDQIEDIENSFANDILSLSGDGTSII